MLLEEINSRVKCLAESISMLDVKFTGQIKDLEYRLNDRIDTLEGAMRFLANKLNERMDKLENKIDGVEYRLTKSIDGCINRIENHEIRICRFEGVKP